MTDVGNSLVLEHGQTGLVVSEIGDLDAVERAYEEWRKELALYSANLKPCSTEIRRRFSAETIAKLYAASWEKAMMEFAKRN